MFLFTTSNDKIVSAKRTNEKIKDLLLSEKYINSLRPYISWKFSLVVPSGATQGCLHPPDVSFLITFGSDAYLHIPNKHKIKLDPKCQKLILVGYDQKGRAYRLWHPGIKRISVGVDVIIHETLGFQTVDIMSKSVDSCLDKVTVTNFPCHTTSAASTSTNILTMSDRPSMSNNLFPEHAIYPEHDAYSDNNSPLSKNMFYFELMIFMIRHMPHPCLKCYMLFNLYVETRVENKTYASPLLTKINFF